jgi:hypothetical protein
MSSKRPDPASSGQRLADRQAEHTSVADELTELLVDELEDVIGPGQIGDCKRQARQHVTQPGRLAAAIALTRK